VVQRARIVLRATDGTPNRTVAVQVGVAPMTVLRARDRYARAGLAGLADEPRLGRPPNYSREDRDRVIALTLEPPADGTTNWRACRLGMGETAVWRIWHAKPVRKPQATSGTGQ
jgi:transposase